MLNKAKARAAKAGEKPYKLTDSHRLYLLVKPNGSKLWKWNYTYNGKQKTMNFGIYPMVGLADARAKRDDARAQREEGPALALVERPSKQMGEHSRRRLPKPVSEDFRFPSRAA